MAEDRDMSKLNAALDATREAAQTDGGGKGSKKSQATELVDLAFALSEELWHDPAGDPWITLRINDHRENWRVKSEAMRRWLRRLYFERREQVPGSQAIQDAIGMLEAYATHAGDMHKVHVRVAEHDGRIYVDLCDAAWSVVEIQPNSWRLIDDPPIRFRRARGMMALPIPDPDGDLNELRRFVNVASDDDCRLLVAWLLYAWRADRPYPALVLRGEQGSAKSTTGRILRSLIDPNVSPLRAEPKEVRDLMIAATNSWCIALDNISHLPLWLSDSLCRLATGGGFSTRELYSDGDEALFDVIRPALLTGITDVVTNSDLLDRVVTIDLPRIPDEQRRTERALWTEFNDARPRILGGLFHSLSRVLAEPQVTLPKVPRMADFAENSVAVERAMGWPTGSFFEAYTGNREAARESALEDSLIAPLIRKKAEEGGYCGRAQPLLDWLNAQVDEHVQRQRRWPKEANYLNRHLRLLMTDLRAAGWADVAIGTRSGAGGRQIIIRKVANGSTQPAVGNDGAQVSTPGVDEVSMSASPTDADFEYQVSIGVDSVDTFPKLSGGMTPGWGKSKGGFIDTCDPTGRNPQGVLCRREGCGGLSWVYDPARGGWRCRQCGGPLPPHLTRRGE
jgi:hypothetical protein